MKVALIGATGNVGLRLLAELLRRGHEVMGIARHTEKLQPQPGLTAERGDVNDEEGLAHLLAGHDAVVSAVTFASVNPRTLIDAVKKAGVGRLLVVGGADVVGMVMKETMLLVLIGVGIGMIAALAASRLISHMLFGLGPNDPLTVLAATSVLLTVAGVAGYFPALRASKVEPLVALRDE